MRTYEVERKTAETDIRLQLNLDGAGKSSIDTGVGFLNHMLTLFAAHGKFDLTVVCCGDSEVDDHHSVEDIGICLGIACVVDRTRADAPSPIPIVASALKLDLPNYAPEECPLCKEGKLPLVHLGSRKMQEKAKQTL